ncbi:MAG TPA: ABC transporter ATP-binding protein [Rhodanobacteraceae bacterium]|nr:ABC transporter ATP-binding protein [Rhodanobacteraceae bacterium]
MPSSRSERGAAPASAPILEVRDMHVRLGGSHILQGIDFTVPPRGVTALLGRNGVGKTTTLRAILGIVPHRGMISFDGASLDDEATYRIIRRGIGYVPEDRDVFGSLTVAENLCLAERRGVPPRYELAFEVFPDLRDRRRQLAGTLSGGQQQMLSIARALLNPARLLLIDEPSKGLSPRLVSEMVAALARIAKDTTVLLVEQNLAAVRRLADHALAIADGRIAHAGPAPALLGNASLTRQLLGVSSRTGAGA